LGQCGLGLLKNLLMSGRVSEFGLKRFSAMGCVGVLCLFCL
jgi:hypothetical protein